MANQKTNNKLDKIHSYYHDNQRQNLPVFFYLLRKVETFYSRRRIDENKILNSKNYSTGFINKPISTITNVR